MPLAGTDEKIFIQAGSVGFPEEEVLESVTLHDGSRKKKYVQLIVVRHNSGVRYKLSIKEYLFSKGTLTEKSNIHLDEDATDKLFQHLISREQFADIARTSQYTIVEGLSPLNSVTIKQLVVLLRRASVNKQLADFMPTDVVSNFTAVFQQIRYKKAVEDLERMLSETHSEKEYEEWFLENHWVFGTEYLRTEDNKKVGWRSDGDIILTSTDGYQDIIELKLPTEDILKYDKSHDNWYPSSELSKAISQAIKYLQESEDVRTVIKDKEKLPFLKPRAKIVIGRSDDWELDRLNCLRKLNCELHNIQVMTYDHLLMSAKRMITYYEEEEKVIAEQLAE